MIGFQIEKLIFFRLTFNCFYPFFFNVSIIISMKNRFSKIAVAAAVIFLAACGKDVSNEGPIAAYEYASLDPNGGDWKPILLTAADQFPLPAPSAVGSAEYAAELAAMKTASQNLTAEQQAAVDYWGANGVVRWNEILREFVAKYNIPPAPNADGTYPVPDATKPDQYPLFPFANPPYASRAYAYLSAATFDALIACWHAKRAHARPATWKNDATIKPLLPATDLPGYPSEDAVVAAVSRTILSAMFPNEKALVAALAEEEKNSRLHAGMNVQSDLAAGDSLGRKVAQFYLARAKTDLMGKANDQTIVPGIKAAIEASGETAWVSLESPARPPMLPAFGNVKPWFIPSAADVRPGPPPSTKSADFQKELDEVKETVQNLTDSERNIAIFWADGLSTYTPPGQWNLIGCVEMVVAKWNLLRTARGFAYLNTAMADGGIACWNAKYFYFNPRPSQMNPDIKTFVGVPNFPAYVSGHSTFSSAGAEVLGHLFPSKKSEFDRLAKEASESRIYGGIHYRADCETGLLLGKTCGQYTLARADADGAE